MKKLLAGVAISLVTIILLLFAGEFWVHNFVLVTRATGKCDQLDPIVKFKGIPNTTCTSRTPEWNVINKHNSYGLRSPETTIEKPPGTYRILFLGDSFTQGYGVNLEEAFPQLVEKELNGHFKNKFKVEVINSGVPNYSPLLEYLYLINEGYKFKPDLVILEFDLTDFSNDFVYGLEAVYNEQGVPTAVNATPSALPKESTPSATLVETSNVTSQTLMSKSQLLPFLPLQIKTFLHDHSVLYKWMSTQLKLMLGQPIADPQPSTPTSNFYTIVNDDPQFDETLWKAPRQNLRLINDFLKEQGIPFIVSAHPHAILVNGQEWPNGRLMHGLERDKVYSDRYFSQLETFLKSENIPFINLLPHFRSTQVKNLYFPYDGHFTTNGHRVTADGITQELLKLSVLKPNQ